MEMRDKILCLLREEIIGPSLNAEMLHVENEVLSAPPYTRYIDGILYPRDIERDMFDDSEKEGIDDDAKRNEVDTTDSGDEEITEYEEVEFEDANIRSCVETEFDPDEIDLTKAFYQSSIGISFHVKADAGNIPLCIEGAWYNAVKRIVAGENEGSERTIIEHVRNPFRLENKVKIQEPYSSFIQKIDRDGFRPVEFRIHVKSRRSPRPEIDSRIVTIAIENITKPDKNSRYGGCIYQAGISLRIPKDEIIPYPDDSPGARSDQRDVRVNRLLYREVIYYAIGHGCSADWIPGNDEMILKTEFMPSYELKPVDHGSIDGLDLSMRGFSDLVDDRDFVKNLESLNRIVSEYERWITKSAERADSITDEQLKKTAWENIEDCRKSRERIKNGIELLKTDPTVKNAFRYMNHAMLEQQYRSNIPARDWEGTRNGNQKVWKPMGDHPPIDLNPDLWKKKYPGHERLGKWRLFQLAFILQALCGVSASDHSDRTVFDLIWFPTGGGKTEAYLGLSAFCIFFERLSKRAGISPRTLVLMRYTLRLLTSQQFERCASLVLACEKIRQGKPSELGEVPVSLGLFVGDEVSPNTRGKAQESLKDLMKDFRPNRFVLVKCPWCGSAMGVVTSKTGKRELKAVKGYEITENVMKYRCHDEQCHYHNSAMPVTVVDEDIFSSPPDVVIGTIDKFAMIPLRPDIGIIFGKSDNKPPVLIIQDELHLISGPLGSIFGLYETLLSELYSSDHWRPKIIGSTATINRSREQVNSIYNIEEDKICQFPPPGIDFDDSFFSMVNRKATGRLYAGVCAHASSSFVTTQVRVFSSLLQASKLISDSSVESDPWWTLICYFNTLFELGRSSTLFSQDIRQHLRDIHRRKEIIESRRRYVNRHSELTARISGSEIPAVFNDLKTENPEGLDACLCTNMLSVGVDVPRLSLMAMVGQPKTVAEYIQATSRVGRRHPGLVITMYNNAKPRDISYYEHFRQFHQKPYASVEPSSVTPFSLPALERALHAIVFGLIRQKMSSYRHNPPKEENERHKVAACISDEIRAIVIRRLKGIDPEMESDAVTILNGISEKIKRHAFNGWNDYADSDNNMVMFCANLDREAERPGWQVMTSMRNVDRECLMKFINPADQGE